jgi:hypothetical protein
MSASVRRKRRRGFRLDDYVVGRLPVKRKQYTVWDLAVEGCGVRISSTTRSCVISVRLGAGKKFETIGRVSPDSPYEYLRELAVKRIGELKHERLPRAPLRQMSEPDPETLRQALDAYIAARPDLSEQTAEGYREILERGLPHQMDQPVALLVAAEILRLNTEHLETLTRNDPTNKPPVGFWAWQAARPVDGPIRVGMSPISRAQRPLRHRLPRVGRRRRGRVPIRVMKRYLLPLRTLPQPH